MKPQSLLVAIVFAAAVCNPAKVAGEVTPAYASGGEPDLFAGLSSNPQGNIMDTLYGPGNYTRVDDSLDQVWMNSSGAARIRGLWGSTSYLYYNSESHPDFFVSAPVSGGYIDQAWAPLPIISEPFNWKIQNPAEGTFSSIPTQNNGEDHMVTFEITGNNGRLENVIGHYVIAWEAAQYLGDKDYQDFVVEVSSVSPVPEPGTVVLFTISLLGVAGILRLQRPYRRV